MIRYSNTSIFSTNTEALVNPVNCVGTMGKGLALAFSRRYPKMIDGYREACKSGDLQVGKCWTWHGPRTIVCLPTKRHWMEQSTMDYVQRGLVSLVAVIIGREIQSVAVPMLGCGLGGLRWPEVRPLIVGALEPVDCDVVILGDPE